MTIIKCRFDSFQSLLGVRRLRPHEWLGRGHGPWVPLGDVDSGAVLLEPLVHVAIVVLVSSVRVRSSVSIFDSISNQ